MLKLIIAAILAATVLAGSVGQPATPAALVGPSDDPIVVIRRDGGMGDPIVSLHFALWEDGTMICPMVVADPEFGLIVAKAAPGHVELLLERLEKAQFFDRPSTLSLPPDASCTVILATNGERANSHGWWEHLGTSSGAEPDPEGDKFIQMWLDTRAAIVRVRPEPVGLIENELDENGRFRGYHPKHPERTPWLKHGWRPEATDSSER